MLAAAAAATGWLAACGPVGVNGGGPPWRPHADQRPETVVSSEVELYSAKPVGWASVSDLGQDGTTGGGDLAPVMVTTIEELNLAAAGVTPAVIKLAGPVAGSFKFGSNKTLLGSEGATFTGHIGFDHSANVIVRDLVIVGNNCLDNPDCEAGADAVTISDQSHHVWFDHCDVSDGSDGNLDINGASDYVTVSWTKFHYSGFRPGGHQFSNLIGSSDRSTGDAGHLRVTFHHVWWAEGVGERMPRVRFGQVHLFNNLYTSVPSAYCVGLGVNANILTEDTVFAGVREAMDIDSFSNAQSVAMSFANLYQNGTNPTPDYGTTYFTPPYPYTVQPAAEVEATVRANVGPHY